MTTVVANQVRRVHIRNSHTNTLAALAREMSIPTFAQLRSPSSLQWWEWGKVLGIVNFIIVAILSMANCTLHPLVLAMLLHITADFSCQSSETSLRKGKSKRHLLVHALVGGGLPIVAVGLTMVNPVALVTRTVISVVVHYVVDRTQKFGLGQTALGIILDQACHLLTILILVAAV